MQCANGTELQKETEERNKKKKKKPSLKTMEADESGGDLKSRIRLIQSKLYPSAPSPPATPSPRSDRRSECDELDELDSLSLCSANSSASRSSRASSGSSGSSAAPTPPPRLSSLRQSQSEQAQATGGSCNPLTAGAATSGGCRRQELSARSSGDNECAPLVPHASRQHQVRQHQLPILQQGASAQQLLALQRANMIIGQQRQHLYPQPQTLSQQQQQPQLPANCWPQQLLNQQQHLQQQQQQQVRLQQQQHANLKPNLSALKTPIRADQSNNNYKPQATCYAGQQQQIAFSSTSPAANRFGLSDAPNAQITDNYSPAKLPPNANLFAVSADPRTPITKAVQDMVNQQQQATFVINNQPSSRQPIYGCTPALCRRPAVGHAHPLGSVSSASLSSISSGTSTGSSGKQQQHKVGGGLLEVARTIGSGQTTSLISPTKLLQSSTGATPSGNCIQLAHSIKEPKVSSRRSLSSLFISASLITNELLAESSLARAAY